MQFKTTYTRVRGGFKLKNIIKYIVLDTLSYLINTTSFDITPFRIHTLTYVISPGHSPSHIQIRNFACTYG